VNILPLDQLGARESATQPGTVDFGILLPNITPNIGTLFVRIIHQDDQFVDGVRPVEVPLSHSQLPTFGDYWSGSIDIPSTVAPSGAQGWGGINDEQYVYRYVLKLPNNTEIDDIIDPFAREYGFGDISAITLGYVPFQFDPLIENAFKVPNIKDAIVYELNIAEMGGDLPNTIDLLNYVASLNINVIEVMPVCNTAARVDWGYDPLGYFGVASRFGKRRDFQRFVQEAHARNIAVVLDSVYGHVEKRFAYANLYYTLNIPSPFVAPYAVDQFFESTDFSKSLCQDYYFTLNLFWLKTFHIDGFRYDDVPEYWDQKRPVGQQGFSDLVSATLTEVISNAATTYTRFIPTAGGEITLLQIPEFLGTGSDDPFLSFPTNPPQHVLFDTVSNSTWQNQTMEAAKSCARGEAGAIAAFGFCLGLQGYPTSLVQNGVTITKSALQYIETHDHERFICTFGTHFPDKDSQDPLLLVGNRDQSWFKVQPYFIALLMAKGTPLLWQGQEFCEDYDVPNNGSGRVAIYRPLDFNKFYDPIGKVLVNLVRKLAGIRRSKSQFTNGDHFFYGDGDNFNRFVSKGLLAYSRRVNNTFSLVVVNFTNQDQSTSFAFPIGGQYTELLSGQQKALTQGAESPFTVPSNFGCIWTIN